MPQPKLLSKAWASDGLKNSIPDTRSAGMPQEGATYADGFPSITMTPISTGGKPPSGKDMNGVLYEISAHTVWQNQGGRYRFDQAFCDAIGGYPKGAVLINDTLDTEYISLVDANTHNPNNGGNTGKWAIHAGKGLKAGTTQAGIVQLSSDTGSQAEDRAATPKAVKAAYDKATEAVNVARAISIPTATTSRAGIVQLTDRVSNAAADAGKTPTTAAVNSAIDDVSGRIAQANTRIDNAVTLSSNQTITAAKTFHSDIKVSASTAHANADRYIRLGADATGAYAVNSKSNKVLYLKHDGNITYDDKRLLNADDLIGIIPSGAVMYFAGRTAPSGWLKANGAAVSRTTYAALFAAIGTTYGAGDGRSTFNLPDLRGEFLRGWDDGRGIDSGRAFGSAQSDAIRNIKGSLEALYGSDRYALYTKAEGAFTTDLDDGGNETFKSSGNNYANRKKRVVFDAGRSVPTADENRPRNISLLACIKI